MQENRWSSGLLLSPASYLTIRLLNEQHRDYLNRQIGKLPDWDWLIVLFRCTECCADREMPRSPQGSKVGSEPGSGISKEPPAAPAAGRVSSPPSEEDDDEDEILEISENGRWQKINEQVGKVLV